MRASLGGLARKAAVGIAAVTVLGAALPPTAAAQAARSQQEAETRTLGHASRLERAGRLAEARRLIEQLLEDYPASFNGLVMLDRILTAEGGREALIPFAERAVIETGQANGPLLQIWIRALATAGYSDSARAAAQGWLDRAPDEPAAYLELAFAERQAGDTRRAIELLYQGRKRLGDPDVFTQELAQLLVESDRYRAAAAEWVTMLGWGQAGASVVERSLAMLRGEPYEKAVGALWEELLADRVPLTVARAALQVAFALGDSDRAQYLVRGLADKMPSDSRLALLRDFVLEARNRDMPEAAAWAAARLADESPSRGERLQWHAVVAELAFQTGDESTAREAFETLAREAEVGTEAHRVATRRVFNLSTSTPEEAERLLRDYARHYSDSELEIAQMAVELSHDYAAAGDLPAARRILGLAPAQPADAAVASMIEEQRGRLALYSGDVDAARASLAVAVAIPGPQPARRTETIALFDVLSQTDSLEAVAVGRILFDLLRDPGSVTAAALIREWESRPGTAARPKLVLLAASELQTAGQPDQATAVRRWLIGTYPEAPEAAPALLDLARTAAQSDPELARHYLETLVVDHPASAVAPLGRRLLAELSGRVPQS